MLPFIALTALATVALLVADARGSRTGVWLAKPVAALGFVLTAVAAGALGSVYGTWLLIALLLCLLGDVLLIPEDSESSFRAGVLAFLLGHVTFAVAFAVRGLDLVGTGVGLLGVTVPLVFVLRWLAPHVPGTLRTSIYAYMLVISCMVVCAAGAVAAGAPALTLLGALGFAISDLAVARNQFVENEFRNRLWGLPLYFGCQLLLASTVAGS